MVQSNFGSAAQNTHLDESYDQTPLWKLYAIAVTTKNDEIDEVVDSARAKPRTYEDRHFRQKCLYDRFTIVVRDVLSKESRMNREDKQKSINLFLEHMASTDGVKTLGDVLDILCPSKGTREGVRDTIFSLAYIGRAIKIDRLHCKCAKTLVSEPS